jgi:hypothetical protein
MRRTAPLVLLLLLLWPGSERPAAADATCRTIAVAAGRVPYPHERTLRAAVAAARPCDWILVAPGVYRGPVTIRTPDLHIRGLDRNRVIIDGGHRIGNGITVEANDVWIENLTVRNFDRASRNDDGTGTEIAWSGVHGWWGRYLTAYDDGLLGGYGVWAARSRDGGLGHVYASGFDDSGLYVGACRDCRALVADSSAEHNLVGLAATNASGRFVVERSLFRDNAVGISLNSSTSDPPPPQLGTCDAGRNRSEAPKIATTRLARCTVLRDNRVLDNDALDVPSETSSVRPGSGIGIDLLGSYGDLTTANTIEGNRNVGVLGLQLPLGGQARFALAGDRISGNRIVGSRLAVALSGGVGSVDDCIDLSRPAATEPADLRPFSCARTATPAPPKATSRLVLALVRQLHAQLAAAKRRAQAPPPPQPSMPEPCRGVPPTPLCRHS